MDLAIIFKNIYCWLITIPKIFFKKIKNKNAEELNEIRDENGNNVLLLACLKTRGRVDRLVEFLINLGMDVNAQNQEGLTIWDSKNKHVLKVLNRIRFR